MTWLRARSIGGLLAFTLWVTEPGSSLPVGEAGPNTASETYEGQSDDGEHGNVSYMYILYMEGIS